MIGTVLCVLGQIIVGLLYANLTEWIIHKYILHDLGKTPESMFSFHWWSHHKASRTNAYYDADYEVSWWRSSTRRKEVFGLCLLVVSHAWVVLFFPAFWLTLVFAGFMYYFIHKKSHLDVEWGKKWTRSHFDHHMGRDQDQNWAVTFPLSDYLLNTRVKYSYDEKGRAVKVNK